MRLVCLSRALRIRHSAQSILAGLRVRFRLQKCFLLELIHNTAELASISTIACVYRCFAFSRHFDMVYVHSLENFGWHVPYWYLGLYWVSVGLGDMTRFTLGHVVAYVVYMLLQYTLCQVHFLITAMHYCQHDGP